VFEEYGPLLFKPETKSCLANTDATNLVGDSSRDCWDSNVGILKYYSRKSDDEVYDDALTFSIKFNLAIDAMNSLLAEQRPGLTNYEIACNWLKKNGTHVHWSGFILNTYVQPGNAISVEAMIGIVLSVGCFILASVFAMNYFEIILYVETFLVDTPVRLILGEICCVAELIVASVAFFSEILDNPDVPVLARHLFIIFICLKCISWLSLLYLRISLLCYLETNDSAMQEKGLKLSTTSPEAKGLLSELVHVHNEAETEFAKSDFVLYSLFLTELPLCILLAYMLFIPFTRPIFIASLLVNFFSLGCLWTILRDRVTWLKILAFTQRFFVTRGKHLGLWNLIREAMTSLTVRTQITPEEDSSTTSQDQHSDQGAQQAVNGDQEDADADQEDANGDQQEADAAQEDANGAQQDADAAQEGANGAQEDANGNQQEADADQEDANGAQQ